MAVSTVSSSERIAPAMDDASSNASSPSSSTASSTADLKGMEKTATLNDGTSSRRKSLEERSKIPSSFYMMVPVIFCLQYFGGLWSVNSLKSLHSSVTTAAHNFYEWMAYTRELMQGLWDGEPIDRSEYLRVFVTLAFGLSIFYVFVGAPFKAGLWTGRRALRHKFHRFMGLAYMAQYSLAWVEFLTNYEGGAEFSLLPHTIALNGIMQSSSAFFSFKVLPELEDAGYYSDKAVMSRKFVHENIFFTLMTVFGSVYYNQNCREMLRSHPVGRLLEYAFVFWPYIVIRTWYPITRFNNAGTTYKGRTAANQKFYEIATTMVKIFFLWAKYFLGFYFNFLVFLDLVTEEQWKFLHGMFLLNVGTVSLAMFLHTLRFKKVLPAKFTFSFYLLQIYATFSAIPYAFDMFVSHPKLCGVVLAGLLGNMTRNRKIHALWCLGCMIMLNQDIEW